MWLVHFVAFLSAKIHVSHFHCFQVDSFSAQEVLSITGVDYTKSLHSHRLQYPGKHYKIFKSMENVQGYYENTVDEIQTKADIFQEKFITGQGYLTCHILSLRCLMSTYFYPPVSSFSTNQCGWEDAMFGLKLNFSPLVWMKKPCSDTNWHFFPLFWKKKTTFEILPTSVNEKELCLEPKWNPYTSKNCTLHQVLIKA